MKLIYAINSEIPKDINNGICSWFELQEKAFRILSQKNIKFKAMCSLPCYKILLTLIIVPLVSVISLFLINMGLPKK